MNAGDRARIRKQKHRQMMMRLWMPVALVVVLIMGLTIGGVAMSLKQTKGTTQQETKDDNKESKGEDETNKDDSENESAEDESRQESEPQSTEESTQQEVQDYATEQADFDEFVGNLEEAVNADKDYFTREKENLTRTTAELMTYDKSHLTESQGRTYDALLDAFNVAVEAEQYESVAAVVGTPMCTVEGGVDYYNYLLKKYSGIDGLWEEFRVTLADEVNASYQSLNTLQAADATLQMAAASFTKQSPDDAYAYDTVSASSSALKKALVCNGLVNGWTEFGIIRAYLADTVLDDAMKQYLIASTRMTYSLYGVADISVHAGNWGEAEVTELCTLYFGEAGGSGYGANVYQMVLKNPGKYAAAAIDYLQITQIEAALASQLGENYSEANLIDILFNQGPANPRVIRGWLGI